MTVMPRYKTARLAPYVQAIKEAHEAGWTWQELLDLVNGAGLDIAERPVNFRLTFNRAMKRYEKATYKPAQRPLTDLYKTTAGTEQQEQSQQNQPRENAGDRKEDSGQVDIEDYESDSEAESKPESDSDTDDDITFDDDYD